MADYKRKKYFVKEVFQLKYTGIILLSILSTVLLAGAMIYYTVFPYLSEKLANVYPQNRLVIILAQANVRLLYVVLVLIPLAAWLGIMLSHRIAGPWYKLENILVEMSKGNVSEAIKLRKNDELKSLADALNSVTARIRTDKQNITEHLSSLQNSLAKLQSEADKAQPDSVNIKEILLKLQASADNLKTLIA